MTTTVTIKIYIKCDDTLSHLPFLPLQLCSILCLRQRLETFKSHKMTSTSPVQQFKYAASTDKMSHVLETPTLKERVFFRILSVPSKINPAQTSIDKKITKFRRTCGQPGFKVRLDLGT